MKQNPLAFQTLDSYLALMGQLALGVSPGSSVPCATQQPERGDATEEGQRWLNAASGSRSRRAGIGAGRAGLLLPLREI